MSSLDLLMYAAASANPNSFGLPSRPAENALPGRMPSAMSSIGGKGSPFLPIQGMPLPSFPLLSQPWKHTPGAGLAATMGSINPALAQRGRAPNKRKREEAVLDSSKDMTPPTTVSDGESDAPSTPESRPMVHMPSDAAQKSLPVAQGPLPDSCAKKHKKVHKVPTASRMQQDMRLQLSAAQHEAQRLMHQNAMMQLFHQQYKDNGVQSQLQQQRSKHNEAQQQLQLQHQQLLNSQLHKRLLQLQQQQSLLRDTVSQGSCFVKSKKDTAVKKSEVNPNKSSVTESASGSLPLDNLNPKGLVGLVPGSVVNDSGLQDIVGIQRLAAMQSHVHDAAPFSTGMLSGTVSCASACDGSMSSKLSPFQVGVPNMMVPNPYVMALNNAVTKNMLGQIGGIEAQKAETRRREQRRLSAQRRRERKRGTLAELETKLCTAKALDTDLLGKLNEHLAATASSGTCPAQAVLNACDPAVLKPQLPVWKDIIEKARKEARGQCASEAATATADSGALSEMDKLKLRRERNRISARMSRLRKRLRQDYLQQTLDMLSKRIEVLKSALSAGGVSFENSATTK